MRLADVDGDGDLDMLTMGNSIAHTSTQLLVKLNDGKGNFSAGWSATIPIFSPWQWRFQLEAADVDNDGDLDILCTGNEPFVYVFINDGKGTFRLQSSVLTDTSYNLVVGDFDADGDLDFLETIVGPSSHVFMTYYKLGLNDGKGNFTVRNPLTNMDATNAVVEGARALDNNGTLDLLEKVFQGPALAVRFNSGSGTFGPSQVLTTATESLVNWVCTDFDNDHDLDVLLLVKGCASCAPGLKVLYNDGAGGFGNHSALPVSGLRPGDQRLALADLTGDGRPDLLVTTSLADSVRVLLNLGNGTFGPARSYASAPTTHNMYAAPALALGDLDGDGDVDVAAPSYPVTYPVENSGPQITSVLFNTNVVLATAAGRPLVPTQVWPNPAGANEVLHLALPTPLAAGELRLTTVLGQEVRRQPVAGAAAEVPLRGLAPGLYLLTVRRAGELVVAQRVAVN